MSSVLARGLCAAAFLAGAVFCGHCAFANAATAEDMLAGALLPSTSPGLLGPITSVGRKGWDCKPEHAASAQSWQAGELPAETASR